MKNIQLVLIALLLLAPLMPVMAQLAPPSGPPATPIDGGLSMLLAAGGIYGFRKLKNSRKS